MQEKVGSGDLDELNTSDAAALHTQPQVQRDRMHLLHTNSPRSNQIF